MSAEPIFEQLFEKMLFDTGEGRSAFREYCLWRCQSSELLVEIEDSFIRYLLKQKNIDKCYFEALCELTINYKQYNDPTLTKLIYKLEVSSNKPLPGIHIAYLMLPAKFHKKAIIEIIFKQSEALAKNNIALAQCNLGYMYALGLGIPPNEFPEKDKIAVDWYRKAADQGLTQAQHYLGVMYEKGRGIPSNDFPQKDEIAVAWFRKAADQGLAQAQYYLGVMYEKGLGIPDEEKLDKAVMAFYWYTRGAKQGDKRCIENRRYLNIKQHQLKKAKLKILRDLSYRQVKFWFEEHRALSVWLLLILNIESQRTGYSGDKTIQNLPIELLFKIAGFVVPLSAAELKDLYDKVIKPLPKEISFKAQYAKKVGLFSFFKFNHVAKRVKSGAPLLLTNVEEYAKQYPKSLEAQVYNEFKKSVIRPEISKEPEVQQQRKKK